MPITKATASSVAPAAKGDLVVGSATNDAAVLGVGSNDQVLTADSSTATGLKWATPSSGGMTLLTTSSWSSGATTISGISGSYTNLMIQIYNVTYTGGVSASLAFRTNGNSSLHYGAGAKLEGASAGATTISTNGEINLDAGVGAVYGVNGNNVWNVMIYDYANTDSNRIITVNGYYQSTSTTNCSISGAVGLRSKTAVSSIEWSIGGGNTANGGTVKIWGIK